MAAPPDTVAQWQALIREGNGLRAAGRLEEAIACYRRAVALFPGQAAARYNLGLALRDARQWREAALAFRDAARLDPADHEAMQNAVTTLALAIAAEPRPIFAATPPRPAGTAPVSIVVCSVREAYLAAMRESFTAALGARAHEFVVIRDARSLCEGYQRGLEAARHGTIVFAHDDVELLSPRPFEALDAALAAHDVVGLVGSRVVSGPAVTWAGHPHIHGALAYPDGDGCRVAVYSLEAGLLGGMRALDGFLFAARREAALSVGFDAATFDGFHFYDLDFTYRAHRAGLRVALTTEIAALHASAGSYDAHWREQARRFSRKFSLPESPQGPHHWYGARMATREHAVRFFDEWRALCAEPAA
jgi:hypothetical protein